MTHRNWSHSVHHWHLPQHHVAPLPRLPRLRLTQRQIVAIRRGLIVALCALLAGSLSYHLQAAARGPLAPTSTVAAARA